MFMLFVLMILMMWVCGCVVRCLVVMMSGMSAASATSGESVMMMVCKDVFMF